MSRMWTVVVVAVSIIVLLAGVVPDLFDEATAVTPLTSTIAIATTSSLTTAASTSSSVPTTSTSTPTTSTTVATTVAATSLPTRSNAVPTTKAQAKATPTTRPPAQALNPLPFDVPGAVFVRVFLDTDWPMAEHEYSWSTPADWQETCRKIRSILTAGGVHSFYQEICSPEDIKYSGIRGDYKVAGYSAFDNSSPEARAAGLFDMLQFSNVHRAYGYR